MTILGILLLTISIFLVIYSIKNKLFIFSFSLLVITFLGIIQLNIFLSYELDILSKLINFNVSKESMFLAQIVFLAISLSSFLFMPSTKNKIRRIRYRSLDDSKVFFIILFTTIIIIFSLYFANRDINEGRPIFSGIGIALGLLLPFSLALIALSNGAMQKALGLAGLFTILHFSRLLFLIGIISIIVYLLEIEKIKIRSYIKLFSLGILLIFIYLINGQFKHLLGQGYDYLYSFINSLLIFEWLYEDNVNFTNLGILSNYFLGIELGVELADCLNNNNFTMYNLIGTANDILNGILPHFFRPNFIEYLQDLSCDIAIVKSPLVDLTRAFGLIGALIYIPMLWGFVRYCELMKKINNNNNSVLFYSTYGIFSVFLIRGSIGAFISFSIALYIGFKFINLCLNTPDNE